MSPSKSFARTRKRGGLFSPVIQSITLENSQTNHHRRDTGPGHRRRRTNAVLHTYVRTDQYTIEYGNRSRLEVPIGPELKNELGLNRNQRLRVDISGYPKWRGEQSQREMDTTKPQTCSATQPVTIRRNHDRQDSPCS
ncbi:hypothetical protein [Haloquadratum walsbyi]|uniref:hypothetical protein n=1 Tax=Haloquadratum walsbyi TaxID=293091 RepID=UPI0026EE1D30|nr:hypothetical protein [Haloquadratum walsbyi]